MPEDKPTPPAINLDSLEREGARPDPFVFILDGHRITMTDASDVDWQELALAIQQPTSLFRRIVPVDQQDSFFKAKLPSWKLNALMNTYFKHYGVDPEALAASSR